MAGRGLAFGPGAELEQREDDISGRDTVLVFLQPRQVLKPFGAMTQSPLVPAQISPFSLLSLLKEPGCEPTCLMTQSLCSVSTNKF